MCIVHREAAIVKRGFISRRGEARRGEALDKRSLLIVLSGEHLKLTCSFTPRFTHSAFAEDTEETDLLAPSAGEAQISPATTLVKAHYLQSAGLLELLIHEAILLLF